MGELHGTGRMAAGDTSPVATGDRWAAYGAGAGAIAVVLFAAGSLVIGERPPASASGAEIADQLAAERTRIQVGSALLAAVAPFFVWFLATVVSLARAKGPAARRAGAVAFGCGLVFLGLFLADVSALAVSALRPQSMAAAPELALALYDLEFLLMGVAAFAVAGALVAFAVLVLRDDAVWPRWIGWLAAIAAPLYALRVGTLFTTDGPFAADGVLGLWVPAGAFAAWTLLASVLLALDLREGPESTQQWRWR